MESAEHMDVPVVAPGRWYNWNFRTVGDGEMPDQVRVLAWRLVSRCWDVVPFAELTEGDFWLPLPGAPVRKPLPWLGREASALSALVAKGRRFAERSSESDDLLPDEELVEGANAMLDLFNAADAVVEKILRGSQPRF